MPATELSSQTGWKISEVVEQLGISADTLRYYEKIGLLKKISRLPSGVRIYREQDMSRLRFIQRAKTMNFSLDEIKQLLRMRENPARARKTVRQLTHKKLQEVEQHIDTLTTLRNELTLLVNLCAGAKDGCPIIDDIDKPQARKK